jgi:hypothetical protein
MQVGVAFEELLLPGVLWMRDRDVGLDRTVKQHHAKQHTEINCEL